MQKVFWFTGRSCSGKTTITKKLEKILEKDFSIQVIDGDKITNKLGGREFKKKHHDIFIKKVVNLVDSCSKENEIVLVAVMVPKEKQRNYVRKILGSKYQNIYLQCSDRCIADRREKIYGKKSIGIFRLVHRLYQFQSLRKLLVPNSYVPPISTDLIINTEKETLDESVINALNFIHPYSKSR